MNKIAQQNLLIILLYSLCLLIAFGINNIVTILTKNKSDALWFNVFYIIIIVIIVIFVSVKYNVTIINLV